MTRRDYVLLAQIMRSVVEAAEPLKPHEYRNGLKAGVEIATRSLAEGLKAKNPRFDMGQFLKDAKVS